VNRQFWFSLASAAVYVLIAVGLIVAYIVWG
jgi:hypothetical protein